VIVSSDLRRAQQTAAALADVTGLPLHTDPRLRETDLGDWQGRLVDEIKVADGARLEAWRAGRAVRPGGGETRGELAERTIRGLRHWLDRVPDGGVLVAVTHGGTARAALGKLLGLPLAAWPVLGGLANGAWSVLEQSEHTGWRLTEHNAGTLPEPVMSDDDA
jgi:glucosyl-3-phosphoglycerate phosphatase